MPFMTPCTQFECETVEPQCWLEPPRTDAEWDEALK
jgi:hypothetical protein